MCARARKILNVGEYDDYYFIIGIVCLPNFKPFAVRRTLVRHNLIILYCQLYRKSGLKIIKNTGDVRGELYINNLLINLHIQ